MAVMLTLLFTFVLILAVQGFTHSSNGKFSYALKAAKASGDSKQPEVLTEASLRQYLGEQGLRYNLNKTDKEIASEGDYQTLIGKMFGATSNNAARIALKKEVRKKAATPNEKVGDMAAEHFMKFGYPRYFPAYMDYAAEDGQEISKVLKEQKKTMYAYMLDKVQKMMKSTDPKKK